MKGIPVLTAKGKGIAEAWENSLVLLNKKGCDIKTMYDKPDDPPSKDATMMITIMNPLAEPMIHKDFPGGLEDLQEYVMEVVEGIKTTSSGIPTTRMTHAGNTPTTKGFSNTGSRALPKSTTRSRSSRKSLPRPPTPAVHRQSPGKCGRTMCATIRHVSRASGAG